MTHHSAATIAHQLRDKNWRIRQQAIFSLSKTQDQQQIQQLIACLDDSHVAVRTAAIKTLVTCDKNAVPHLLDALNNTEIPLIQANCAQILGRIGDITALNPLIAALKTFNEDTRRYAAEALGLLHSPQAVESLIEALNSEQSPAVLSAISIALGRLAGVCAVDPLIERLTHPNQMFLLATTWALAKIRDSRAIHPLIEILCNQCRYLQGHVAAHAQMDGSGHANMPENIAAMLAQFGESAIPALQTLSQDPDPVLRRYATLALCEIDHEQSLETLILQLKDPSSEVRNIALAALFKFGDPNVIALLTSALNDPDPRVRLMAAAGLNKLKK